MNNSRTNSPQLSLGDKIFLNSTVSITGASVMIIELLGSRIISPFYGASLIVWSSLIAVTLLALAIGYYVGGRLADRTENIHLSYIILLAAILTCFIPLISEPIQSATAVMGLRLGAFSSAFLLFTLPLMLLGMTGPFVIKMAARTIDDIASISGSVYAISTVGSVIGTLLLGFFLLPMAGTRVIITSISLILTALSFALYLYERKRMQVQSSALIWGLSCLSSIALIIFSAALNTPKKYDDFTVLSATESHYGWIRVLDQASNQSRWLLADSSTIGVEDLVTGKGRLAYQQIIRYMPRFNPAGKDALLIGLGSGHLDPALYELGITTDSIEIDPVVASAAQNFFNFKPSGRLIIGDARYHIQQLQKNYDFIIHDCFTGGTEPIHLLSIEMLAKIKDRLTDNGILALNFVGFRHGEHSQAVSAVAKTLDTLFPYKRVFISTPGENFNDFIFMASSQPLTLADNRADQMLGAWLKSREVNVTSENGFVITDDYNPLESMQLAKAEHYRNIFIQRMGKEILFW